MPAPKSGRRTDQNEQAVYTNELQTLTKQNRDKFHHISKLLDQAYKATEEENQARKVLNSYITESEQIHGPLSEKVDNVDKSYSTLADLELESEEIREKGNIIADEKQTTMQDDSTLSRD